MLELDAGSLRDVGENECSSVIPARRLFRVKKATRAPRARKEPKQRFLRRADGVSTTPAIGFDQTLNGFAGNVNTGVIRNTALQLIPAQPRLLGPILEALVHLGN